MKIESLKPGMIVWSVIRHRMGSTAVSTTSVYTVRIVEVDLAVSKVLASWNTNPARWYHKSTWAKWRKKEPVMVETFIGCSRLATREEIKAMKAKKGNSQ